MSTPTLLPIFEGAILDAVGLPVVAFFLALPFMEGLVVALEPDNLAVAFEGHDVRGDAVEDPAVVADHHGAAAKVQ